VKRTIKLMVVGGTGSGKTHLSSTFPKSMMAITEPNSEETFLNQPALKKNIVDYKMFIPTSIDDTLRVFKELDAYTDLARERAKKGEIESFILDNFTYLAENRFIYINKYDPVLSVKTGEPDTRGMYGKLGRWLYQFTIMKLLTIPANVIVTCHERLESDEALAKKPDKNNPVIASVLGGFRDDMPGMFSGVFYLAKVEKKQGNNTTYQYLARTNLGQGKLAKNRWNLPPVIENVSYDTIFSAIKKAETK